MPFIPHAGRAPTGSVGATTGKALEPARILILGGTAAIVKAVGAALEQCGHTVTVARDPSTVYRELGRRKFDCALLDDGLLDMYENAVLIRIRKSFRHYPLRVALMTDTPEQHACDLAKEYLAVDVLLAKPFTPRDVRHAVEIMLERRAAQQRPEAQRHRQRPAVLPPRR